MIVMKMSEVFDEVPGRKSVPAFAKSLAGLSREAFFKTHPDPFLIQLSEGSGANANVRTTVFSTVVMSADQLAPKNRDGVWVYEIRKRAGANAFALMVTLGRARNNDIVIDDGSVSKFHATFTKNPDGRWALTDKSTNGTRLDGVKLTKDKAAPLGSGSVITIAHSVEVVFYPAEAAFDHFQRVAARSG
jgi:hypothetical protein